ncbi:hypothetical protein CO121_00775 [bacterium (Candidatus Gribaldobacteria) CG_4_9_14_3_um_filter_36_15]|uniref:Nucleotidyl transferase AbiEii/AbiGii toxin family protein n=1 Tax=bacterium (Candidatus Gribaldobacteria) CG_4_9_14_3_um_filter_36_15 TaxID=2014269 RepID=A0A2M7ZVB9_9BACT|nr:MAG: hypothetical protein CO121_00775 [bacterium (Candidatus Gribaldobacteria) CG_4_9_14_3_um_filter_36_15]
MHQEAITSEAKKVFEKLKNFSKFYLVGGTGLALQLGHRLSVDFDFFWEKEIPKNLLPKLRTVYKDSEIEVILNHSEQLTVTIDGISVSFVKYTFPVISKFLDYQGIKILPAPEIAAMKAYALGQRATFKDYVDLYFVLKEKVANLKEIISLCEKKYREEFDARLFLEQLVYSEDIEEIEIQFLKEKVDRLKIENFFKKEIKKIKI